MSDYIYTLHTLHALHTMPSHIFHRKRWMTRILSRKHWYIIVSLRIRTYVCVYAYIHICMQVCMYINAYVCMYGCIYLCVCATYVCKYDVYIRWHKFWLLPPDVGISTSGVAEHAPLDSLKEPWIWSTWASQRRSAVRPLLAAAGKPTASSNEFIACTFTWLPAMYKQDPSMSNDILCERVEESGTRCHRPIRRH